MFFIEQFYYPGGCLSPCYSGVPGNSDGKVTDGKVTDGKVTDGKVTVVDSFSFPTIPNFSKSMMVIQVLLFSESGILR